MDETTNGPAYTSSTMTTTSEEFLGGNVVGSATRIANRIAFLEGSVTGLKESMALAGQRHATVASGLAALVARVKKDNEEHQSTHRALSHRVGSTERCISLAERKRQASIVKFEKLSARLEDLEVWVDSKVWIEGPAIAPLQKAPIRTDSVYRVELENLLYEQARWVEDEVRRRGIPPWIKYGVYAIAGLVTLDYLGRLLPFQLFS